MIYYRALHGINKQIGMETYGPIGIETRIIHRMKRVVTLVVVVTISILYATFTNLV